MSKTVGIDLGTTNSALAYIDEFGQPTICPNAEGEPTTPSVVAVPASGEIVVGDEALEYRIGGLAPSITFFKREMGRAGYEWDSGQGIQTAVDLSTAVLRKLLDDAAVELGERPETAVVTVPAYFRDPERMATKLATERAGLTLLQMVNEPTAAAIAYGMKVGASTGKVLVYDLGGGTFDISIVEFGAEARVIGSGGDHHLGGKDWDERLVALLTEAFESEYGFDPFDDETVRGDIFHQAELAKKRLSKTKSAKATIQANGQHGSYEITRAQFDDVTADLVQRTLMLTDQTLEKCGVAAEDLADVLLVGGSTRMPMVLEALTVRFGRSPKAGVNPDEAVALGAALLAEQRVAETGTPAGPTHAAAGSGIALAPRIADVTNHSLGMIAIDDQGTAFCNSIILAKNSPVPGHDHRPYRHLFRAPGDELEIFLTQGESRGVDDVAYLGRYVVRNLPGIEYGKRVEIEIDYAYDESALVKVSARLAGQGAWNDVTREDVPGDVPARFHKIPEPEIVREPLTIYIFIDVSGSMSGKPVKKAKEAARDFLAKLDLSMTSLGIGVVADRAVVLQEATQDAGAIEKAIDRIEVGVDGSGGANRGHPFNELKARLDGKAGMKAGVILADGRWSHQKSVVNVAKECHAQDIAIVGIGFGSADEAFLRDISSEANLSVFTCAEGLSEAFVSVAQELSNRSGIRMGR